MNGLNEKPDRRFSMNYTVKPSYQSELKRKYSGSPGKYSIDDIEFSHTRASPDLDKLKNFFEKVGVNKNTIKVWNKFITCQ